MSVTATLGVAVIFAIVFLLAQRIAYPSISIACVGLAFATYRIANRSAVFRLSLVNHNGEVLLVDGDLHGRSVLFLLDTGYAGAPIISTTYLATVDSHGSVAARYAQALESMASVSADDRRRALDKVVESSCLSYTAGCTMRLQSIGSTSDHHADMLLCQRVRLRDTNGFYAKTPSRGRADADVFVTSPLSTSPHILTCDFMLQSAPCLINLSSMELELCIPLSRKAFLVASGMKRVATEMHGGAFVIPLVIGDQTFRCTMDTGSPGPVNLGFDAAQRLQSCTANPRGVLFQRGVLGETVCSHLIEADTTIANFTFQSSPVYVNDAATPGVDGYVGMGLLRAFDILLDQDGVYIRRSHLTPTPKETYANKLRSGKCKLESVCKQALNKARV